MKPVMYLILNAGAGMSPGKLAAQAAHAAVEAYEISEDNNTRRVWRRGGHYTKVVLRATDAEDLKTKERYINDRGFKTALIIDEGRTEIDPFTPTAIGVEILDKDHAHVAATFSSFDLYKEEKPLPLPQPYVEPYVGPIPAAPPLRLPEPWRPDHPWHAPRIWCGSGDPDVRVRFTAESDCHGFGQEAEEKCGRCGGTADRPGMMSDDSYSTFPCWESFHRR